MSRELTFLEHLEELRRRAIIILLSIGAGTLISVPFAPVLLKVLKYPSRGMLPKLAFFGPEEAFVIYMRIAFSAGLVIALPVLLHQLWGFVSPAVHDRFKRKAGWFIFLGGLAFIAGCSFSYFVLLPSALSFLLSIGTDDFIPMISAERYVSFVTILILATGAIFEMPVLSFFLTRLGVLNHRMLRSSFKYALIAIAIISAVITPTTDIFNMMCLMLPMLILYEVSIWVSYFSARSFPPEIVDRSVGGTPPRVY